ncbi:MAG: hypothetical protein Q7R71_01995 [bacterium]|nr:hypothetical protein [bacterium]
MTLPLEIAAQAMADVISAKPTIKEQQVTAEYRDDRDSPEFQLTLMWQAPRRIFCFFLLPTSMLLAERDGLTALFSNLNHHANALLNRFDEETDAGEYRVVFPTEGRHKEKVGLMYHGGFVLPFEYTEGIVCERLRSDLFRAVRAGRIATPLLQSLAHKRSLPGSEEYHRLVSIGLGLAMLRETQTHATSFDIYLRNTFYYQQGDALRSQ